MLVRNLHLILFHRVFCSVLVLDRLSDLLQLPLELIQIQHLVRLQLLPNGRGHLPHLFCVVFLIFNSLRHEVPLDCDGQLNCNEPLVQH